MQMGLEVGKMSKQTEKVRKNAQDFVKHFSAGFFEEKQGGSTGETEIIIRLVSDTALEEIVHTICKLRLELHELGKTKAEILLRYDNRLVSADEFASGYLIQKHLVNLLQGIEDEKQDCQ